MNEGYHRIPSFHSSRNFQRNNQITSGSDACLKDFQTSSVGLSSKKGNISDHRRGHSHTATIKCDQLDKALDEDKVEPKSFGIPDSKTKTRFPNVFDMKNPYSSALQIERHYLKHCPPEEDGANFSRNKFRTPRSLNFEFSRRTFCHPIMSDANEVNLMRNRSLPRSGRKSSRKVKSKIGRRRHSSERMHHKNLSPKRLTKSSNKLKSCTPQKHGGEDIVKPSVKITKSVSSDDEKSEHQSETYEKRKVKEGSDEKKIDDGVVDKVQLAMSFQERLSQGSLNDHKKVRNPDEDKSLAKVNGLSKVACEAKQPSTANKNYAMQSDKRLNKKNGISKENSEKGFLNNSENMTCKKLKTSKKRLHKLRHSNVTNKDVQFEPYREVNLLWSKKCLSETKCSDVEPDPDLDVYKKCKQLKSKSKSIQRKVFGPSRDYIEGCLQKYHSWCQKPSGRGCGKPKVQTTQIYQSYPIFPNYSTQSYGPPCTQSYQSFCHCASIPRNLKTVSGSSRVSVDHHTSDSSSENLPEDVEIDLCYAPRYCCCMTCQNAQTAANPAQVIHSSIERPLILGKSASIGDSFGDVIKGDFRRTKTEVLVSDKMSMLKNLDERFAEVFDEINIPDNKSNERISDTIRNNSLEALRRRCCNDKNSPRLNNCENTCDCAVTPTSIITGAPKSNHKKIKIPKNNLADYNLNTCRNNNAAAAADNLDDDCIMNTDHPGVQASSPLGLKAESISEIKLNGKVKDNRDMVSRKVGREMLEEKQLSKLSDWTSISDYKAPPSESVCMELLDNQKFEMKDYPYPNLSSWCDSASIVYGNILIPKLDLSFLNDEVSDQSQRMISGNERRSFDSSSSSTPRDNIYEGNRIEGTNRSVKSAKKLISDNFVESYHDSNNINHLNNTGIRNSGNTRKENFAELNHFPEKCFNQSNSNILPEDGGCCQGNNSLFPQRKDSGNNQIPTANSCAIVFEPKRRSRFSMLPHFYSAHKEKILGSSDQVVHNETMTAHETNKSEVCSGRKINKFVQNIVGETTDLRSYPGCDVHTREPTEIRESVDVSNIHFKGGLLSDSVRTNNADIQNNLPAAHSHRFSLINERSVNHRKDSSHLQKSEKTIQILQKVKDKLLMENKQNRFSDCVNLKSSHIKGFGRQMPSENEAGEFQPLMKKTFDLEGAKMHIRKIFDRYR